MMKPVLPVVIMASKITEDKFAEAMKSHGGTLLKTSLTTEDEGTRPRALRRVATSTGRLHGHRAEQGKPSDPHPRAVVARSGTSTLRSEGPEDAGAVQVHMHPFRGRGPSPRRTPRKPESSRPRDSRVALVRVDAHRSGTTATIVEVSANVHGPLALDLAEHGDQRSARG